MMTYGDNKVKQLGAATTHIASPIAELPIFLRVILRPRLCVLFTLRRERIEGATAGGSSFRRRNKQLGVLSFDIFDIKTLRGSKLRVNVTSGDLVNGYPIPE